MVTVCTKDRRPALANPYMHTALLKSWQAADHWLVGRYVVMPDHLHLFCAPGTATIEPLVKWVRYWKSFATKSASFSSGDLWQRDFWDTQLRQGDSYAAKWKYVADNPVRAGLTSSAELWPYQGEVNILRWHD